LPVVNLIVYMGAIMVLSLFVLMLLDRNKDTEPMTPVLATVMGAIAGTGLLATCLGAFRALDSQSELVTGHTEVGLVKNLGKVLFNEFLLPFELSSILLLTAMVGAILLAKKETKEA